MILMPARHFGAHRLGAEHRHFDAFVAVRPMDRLELSLNASNLFDVYGYTEAEEGAIPGNGLVRARSIAGRSILASARIDF